MLIAINASKTVDTNAALETTKMDEYLNKKLIKHINQIKKVKLL